MLMSIAQVDLTASLVLFYFNNELYYEHEQNILRHNSRSENININHILHITKMLFRAHKSNSFKYKIVFMYCLVSFSKIRKEVL